MLFLIIITGNTVQYKIIMKLTQKQKKIGLDLYLISMNWIGLQKTILTKIHYYLY